MNRPDAGSIVVVDWRSGQHPEPGGLRPGVVVENSALMPPSYPALLVVPLTRDERLVAPDLAVRLDPTATNGVTAVSWALAHHVNSVALRRVRSTPSRVTEDQLAAIRRRIAFAVGFDADLPA